MVFLLKFTYSKIYFFGYSSMSVDKCLELWNYHHNQDIKQFNHPSKILVLLVSKLFLEYAFCFHMYNLGSWTECLFYTIVPSIMA